MANKLDPMDLKQIIGLHHDGLSNRKIAKLLGIVRNTVNAYMQLFEACDRSLGELKELRRPSITRGFSQSLHN